MLGKFVGSVLVLAVLAAACSNSKPLLNPDDPFNDPFFHGGMNDGTSAWLSDAQNEFAISYSASGQQLPAASDVRVAQHYTWNDQTYTVTVITTARYRGVEGELPFPYWDKDYVTFADLRSQTGKFATLDYSDQQPALYLGEFVEFDDLKLKNLRPFEGW